MRSALWAISMCQGRTLLGDIDGCTTRVLSMDFKLTGQTHMGFRNLLM